MPSRIFLAALLVSAASALYASEEATKLLRFPDIHKDQIVFTHGGDLWLVSAEGGRARQLTSTPGVELFAKFSPDGSTIAFTAQIDGDEQVYVIPTAGGAPTQLTFYPARGPLPQRWGYDNQVHGFDADGKHVIFRSLRDAWTLADAKLYRVPVDGGVPEPLILPTAGAADFAPDRNAVFYSPLMRDFRTWKRYQGGWAQDLYLFDLGDNSVRQITDHPRTDRDPIWMEEGRFFVSDRDGRLNLYRADDDSAPQQLTMYDDWDVLWASGGPGGSIVYELAGELVRYDIADATTNKLRIVVPDDERTRRSRSMDVTTAAGQFDLHPEGERVLTVARGDLFTFPVEEGLTRNLTHSSTAHDRSARFSPDGKTIAYVSDASGEEQLYLIDAAGGQARQLTTQFRTRMLNPRWSPSGDHIAFSTADGGLWVIPAEGGSPTRVADAAQGYLTDLDWSPDGRWIAFVQADANQYRSIYLWDRERNRSHRVTDELFDEFSPHFGPEGKYLFYLSAREWAPQMDLREWDYAANRSIYAYTLALRDDVENPFPPAGAQSDDAKKDPSDENNAADDNKEDEKTVEPVEIDLEGLADRIVRLPVDAANYQAIAASEKFVLLFETPPFYYGRSAPYSTQIRLLDRSERKDKVLTDNVAGISLTKKGALLVNKSSGGLELYDLSKWNSETELKPETVSYALRTTVVPAEEWATIFDEVWRRFRDFFYVANMHGVDWEAVRDQYRPLVAHVAHRSDLNFLLGEMVGELEVSHAYVSDGDMGAPERPKVALLGLRFDFDTQAKRFRIGHILTGQNAEPEFYSPATSVGTQLEVGDYLFAINGQPLRADDNPYRLLRDYQAESVELSVADSADGTARRVVLDTIDDEQNLVYLAWILDKRARVASISEDIGYIHVPNMGAEGLREFTKWFYGQVRKDGLIVDVRANGGGNVSQMLIETLGRELLGLGYARHFDFASTYPAATFTGPMVAVINETSASDGDIFPYMFREAGLGPLVGKKTWGGVVGISGQGALLDGGSVFVPQYGTATAAGGWAIEGEGVEPDIEVDQDPVAVIRGKVPQLERAIEELQKLMEQEPAALPERPADRVVR